MEKIEEIVKKLSSGMADNPSELSEYLIILTANLGKFGRARVDKDVLQAKKGGDIRSECDTDGQADKRIKSTEEGKSWQESVVEEKTILELIRSIKARLKSLSDEVRAY